MQPLRRKLAAVGGAVAIAASGLTGLLLTASPASAAPVTEVFAGNPMFVSSGAYTGQWTEISLPENVSLTPASGTQVTQGQNYTMTVTGSSQVVPTVQTLPVINISGLTNILPVPSNATYVTGSLTAGNWSFTDTSGVTTTGPMTATYCTAAGTGCTATATSANFLGSTPTPYIEVSTGSATFTAGGSLTLPNTSATFTATGTGTISQTISEFDTDANVSGLGNVLVQAYPAKTVAAPIASAPAYLDQPLATLGIIAPPAAPVLQNQSASVSGAAAQCVTIAATQGATEQSDTVNQNSVKVVTAPLYGTATPTNDGTGDITYCVTNVSTTPATDTFTYTAAGTSSGLVSAPATATITFSYNTCSAGSGTAGSSAGSLNAGGCFLRQEILLPVTPGQIILSQSSGLPTDVLGSSFCSGGTTPGITLNGNAQAACGAISPLTVTNSTGLDTGWTLTGQVTDFADPAFTGTCDTVATYNNHCIPGDNLSWEPAGAVAHNIVPGDTAQVTAGAIVPPFTPIAPTASANPILQGSAVQPNPVVEQVQTKGLDSAAQTMCSTSAGQSGGTFICAAGLELVIPASIAEPAAPGYVATVTLTLQ